MGDKGMSGESESIADKYFVCTECLVEGNVQSFVDLFYLVAIRPSLISPPVSCASQRAHVGN